MTPVYPRRFTAHLWNNVRSSRLRLHQVILRQCHILASSPHEGYEKFLATQTPESEANIIYFASEILATVPQLSGYLEQVQRNLERTEITPPPPPPGTLPREAPVGLSHSLRNVCATTMEYKSHFLYDQGPFDDTAEQAQKPSLMSVFYADCNDAEIKVDAPAQVAPLMDGPQPASVYHMLFQLYSLRSVPTLPAPFKAWIRERIRWMEYHTESEDLTRLQDMVTKHPGDGFPVEKEG